MPDYCLARLQKYSHRLAAQSASGLAGILGPLMPQQAMFALGVSGKRRRIFNQRVVFWAFLAQILNSGQSCREALRGIQATRARRCQKAISSDTGGYCLARRRLPVENLATLWQRMAHGLNANLPADRLWRGLRVGVVDGTTLSMPDTPDNQTIWPQPSSQKPGCGFPIMKLAAIFSLVTGALHAVSFGSLHNAEHALLLKIWPVLSEFDLIMGDRNFGSYVNFARLQSTNLHGVFRLHQCRKMDWRKGKRLGPNDRLVTWKKPIKTSWAGPEPLPEFITVRVLQFSVAIKGFRTKHVILVTDLLDPILYPAKALAELYLARWGVELFLRHIKITLRMDVLRCLTPHMIMRELHMHLIAYNVIRIFMFKAAETSRIPLARISFKGTCDALRQWIPSLHALAGMPAAYVRLLRALFRVVADDPVPLRPDRSEPRAVKRRPKNYNRLTKPRHLMGNLPHRNRGVN